ncbi:MULTISPECIES: NPCBM/NEW2 domain-containing protein [unclassified Streptomyces]|uniref:NPCBM/NEW2 domain-containing protein n=1 Tax=unclassified Streptomyces TaxID=2593676 RepID=UPI001BEC5C2A|nr:MULTISPECIES: NPCBM/NEW2 domain-containing protein [unclassified Streptomyces]MBT2406206.1 NPCBM/NEW2 domain-containing protein [Streptomyces sp. ISL-21]MBT2609506.1 NPCBM/NEW2 domain-containing protein [Streptomyces sp. ISL-87]
MVTAPPAAALADGQALTPPMGFNNWNSTHCRAEFNEAMVKGIADLFVAKGLKAAGYQYVNLDDCWALPERDASGNLVPDPVRFPNGIKALADYIHGKGLKFGVYTSAGTKTCDTAGFPGGLGHEQQDANLFASFGVDYLKYDNCNNQGVDAKKRYTAMRDALKNTGRPIVFSLCEWGENQPWTWAADVGHLWRTTGDISDSWSSMINIAHRNQPLAAYAGPGHWNDPDMLEVGNGGMTATEYRTHFSLWSMMSAPLLIGSDLRKATPETFDILSNADVIALDQDPLGSQGAVVSNSGGLVVMVKELANGDRAVSLTNETGSTATISAKTDALGIGNRGPYSLKDLWTKAVSANTSGTISASVAAHATVVYRITPGPAPLPPAGTSHLSDLPWTGVSSGWGPVEKDRSNGEQPAGDGRTLTINGATYAKGLGVHAPSTVTYNLGARCTGLTVDVGVDDESAYTGAVAFRIYRDSTLVADSGVVTTSDPARKLTADLTGGQTLKLVVTDGGNGIDYDHADWAAPRLTCA